MTGNEHKGAVERLRETVNLKVTGKYACQVHPDDVRSVLEALVTKDAELLALRGAATRPLEGVEDGDMRWLRALVREQQEGGHCGEGTFERQARSRHNARVDRVLAALTHQEKDAQDG